jgi:hypothetical protein
VGGIFDASDHLCEWNARKDHLRKFLSKKTPVVPASPCRRSHRRHVRQHAALLPPLPLAACPLAATPIGGMSSCRQWRQGMAGCRRSHWRQGPAGTRGAWSFLAFHSRRWSHMSKIPRGRGQTAGLRASLGPLYIRKTCCTSALRLSVSLFLVFSTSFDLYYSSIMRMYLALKYD